MADQEMSRTRYAMAVTVFIAWLILMPLAFATLYTVIELQSAARAATTASKEDVRLATLKTRALARKLDAADRLGIRKDMLSSKRDTAMLDLFEARNDVRASAVDLLSKHGVSGATGMCTAPPADLQACQIEHNMAACTSDWLKITSCYEDARARSRSAPEDRAALDKMANEMAATRTKGFAFNAITRRFNEASSVESAALLPVAEAYRNVRLPFFKAFFALPQGVIVACFTSLMAALGAGVSSLLNFVRRNNGSGTTRAELARSFIISPLLGGLIGFMVYFVVSAGTAFLVQPAPANPAEATNNLSAPALASLGVLAGLAAENAVEWLRAKAAAFFQ